jgi:hypothetical protein
MTYQLLPDNLAVEEKSTTKQSFKESVLKPGEVEAIVGSRFRTPWRVAMAGVNTWPSR